MSDGMPGAVTKGKVLAELERVLNQHREKVYKELKAIDGTAQDSVADALQAANFPPDIAAHLRQHLFPDQPPGYFPAYPKKNGICREALLGAIELAGVDDQKGQPIDCYWICTGSYFQVVATQSKAQVNLLFLTPPPPANLFYLPSSVLEDVHLFVDRYTAYEIEKLGNYPVLDPNAPGGTRAPADDEKPVITSTATQDVKEVVVRRAP